MRTNNIIKRMHPGNSIAILRDAIAGDVIFMDPGNYTVPIYIQEKLHLIGHGQGFTKILGGLVFEAEDSIVSECSIGEDALHTSISDSDYGYKLRNCEIRGKNWNLPPGVVELFNCVMWPSSQDGWLFDGNACITRMYDCRFGEDIPPTSSLMGITISNEARLLMRNCGFYKNAGNTSPGITVDGAGSKLFMHNSRMITDNHSSIIATGGAGVVLQNSYIENDHASLPVIFIDGDANLKVMNSYISPKVSDYAVRTRTTGACISHATAFDGKIDLAAPLAGDQGDFSFLGGGNSISTAGADKLVDPNNKAIGIPFGKLMVGQQSFDGGAAAAQFAAANGTYRMNETATIVVSVVEGAAVKQDDATLSVDRDDGDFIMRRPVADATDDVTVNFIGIDL